jgi:protein-disulfide isomerase
MRVFKEPETTKPGAGPGSSYASIVSGASRGSYDLLLHNWRMQTKILSKLAVRALMLLGMGGATAVAQSSSAALTPAVQQRVEAMLRSKADFPPATTLTFTVTGPSELPGFEKLSAHFASALTGASGDISLLLSKDGSRLAQFSSYDISVDPRAKIPSEGRPARGGQPDAPVLLVVFDDLECPFCARLHKQLFPALTDHYKGQVRVVYQSYPSDGHPWAMHAAVDTDCLSRMNPEVYWAAVDSIHEHAAEYGGSEHKLVLANNELDLETIEQGRRGNVDEAKLKACIEKQDTAPEKASLAIGEKLGVTTTPTTFVNGAKFEGAVPIDFVFDMVDNALRAEGQVPPPRQRTSGQ